MKTFLFLACQDGEKEKVWEQAGEDVWGGEDPLSGTAAPCWGRTEEEEGRCPHAVPQGTHKLSGFHDNIFFIFIKVMT